MVYRGTVKGKAIVLEPGIELPDGAEVRIELVSEAEDPLLGMADLAVDTGISDLASNIDHYLYGHPKVRDAR